MAGLILSLVGITWGAGAGPGAGLTGGGVVAIVLATAAVGQLALAGAALAAQAGDVAARGRQAPRASHLPRPRLGDYLHAAERWLARGVAAVAVVAALVLAVARPGHRGQLLAVAGACLATWVLIELTVLAVVRARPAATDVQSLAFDDALRTDAVRRLLGPAPPRSSWSACSSSWPISGRPGRPWSSCGRSAASPCRCWEDGPGPGPTTGGGCGRPPAPEARPCS